MPSVGYLPSILNFYWSLGSVFIVTHFFVVISSMTKISSANAGVANAPISKTATGVVGL